MFADYESSSPFSYHCGHVHYTQTVEPLLQHVHILIRFVCLSARLKEMSLAIWGQVWSQVGVFAHTSKWVQPQHCVLSRKLSFVDSRFAWQGNSMRIGPEAECPHCDSSKYIPQHSAYLLGRCRSLSWYSEGAISKNRKKNAAASPNETSSMKPYRTRQWERNDVEIEATGKSSLPHYNASVWRL